MCRSIKRLRGSEPPATTEAVRAAARQYIRKVSGFHSPSRANTLAFEQAVDEVAKATARLLESLTSTRAVPKALKQPGRR